MSKYLNTLDYFLKAVCERTENSSEKKGLMLVANYISDLEIYDTLERDGYIRKIDETQGRNFINYIATTEGQIFNEQGGYVNKERELNRLKILEENNTKQSKSIFFLQVVIAIGTAIAAIYYVIEIVFRFNE